MSIIKVEKLWEKYRIKFIVQGRVKWEEIWVLEDVNLNIDKGEIVGIIGQNGAGKTTFLRLLAGMLVPDRGDVAVEGRVAAIMDLGAGLNPEFTGMENIVLNARIYGIDEGVLKQKIDEIIVFSNLGKFIDAPIKYYSQGMYMRLAFALAIFAEPDILLIDDILAVGDEEAQQKCRKKIIELKKSGKTIILVSHDMGVISRLCDRAMLFDRGRIIREGLPQSVIPYYLETAGEKDGIAFLEQQGLRVVFNNGRLSISYMGNYISGSLGGYCSSFDSLLKIHSPSTNLVWRIISNSKLELIAEGKSNENGAVLQHFRITLHDNILDLSIRNAEIPARQHNFNLFLVPVYNSWILSDKEAVFPVFSHRVNWHDLGLDILSEQKLGISTNTDNLLPGLIFEIKAQNSALKIFNSGYEQESRIIHLSSPNSQDLSLSIRVCSKKEDFDNCFMQERQFLLIKQQEEEKIKVAQEKLAREEAERIRQEEETRRIEEEKLAREEAERKQQEEEKIKVAQEKLAREEAERIRQEEETRRIEEEKLAREEAERKQQEEEKIKVAQEKLAREEAERKEQADRELYLRAHTISRGDCRLFVDKENGCLRIYFKDKEITTAGGINSIFLLKHLIGRYWHIEKRDQNELLLSLEFDSEFDSLKQFWSLKFQQNNILTIKIAIEIKKEISIANRFIRLELINGYNFWETPYEKGLFSDSQYVNGIFPVRLKDVRVCQVAVSSGTEELPRVIFEVLGGAEQYVAGIFKQQQQAQEFSCISFCPILPWSPKSLPVGKHDFFEGRIIFDSQDRLEGKSGDKSCALISSQNLQFSFDRGRGNIIWKGKTLSSGLGVYTSLRMQNIWYDSSQAVWHYIKRSKQQIMIKGLWPYIPVAQLWNLKLVSDHIISWEVDIEIYTQVNIEIEQANIMLIEEYSKWLVGNTASGDFMDKFTTDYDILPFRYWYGLIGDADLIVTGKNLPKIIFTNTMPGQMSKGLLENSDYLYHSRILQYQRYNDSVLLPKKYTYFSGLIKIEDK